MKFNALLKVALIGVMFSLLSAQNTYSELDAEIIEEFLAELDELVAETSTSDLDTLLQNEKDETALENQLEQFENVLNSDTVSRLHVKEKIVAKKKGVRVAEEQHVQLSGRSKELIQMEKSLSNLKKELGNLTQQNDQRRLKLRVVTLEKSDIQFVQESSSVAQSFAKPMDRQIEQDNEKIKQLEREAQIARVNADCNSIVY